MGKFITGFAVGIFAVFMLAVAAIEGCEIRTGGTCTLTMVKKDQPHD